MPSCSLLLENTVYKSLLLLLLTIWMSVASAQDVKAVYHITTGVEGAAAALNNIQNHLDADPKARIVVVSNGSGIDFLLQEAKDSQGREFSSAVGTLATRGVEFKSVRQCTDDAASFAGCTASGGLYCLRFLRCLCSVLWRCRSSQDAGPKEGFVYIKP